MSDSVASHLPYTDGTIVEICQCIPGELLITGQTAAARSVLLNLAARAKTGFLPATLDAKKARPDLLANLWFIYTAYTFYRYTAEENTWRHTLLPLAKRMVQGIVSGSFPQTHMGDGGMLLVAGKPGVTGNIARNALWYNAMAILAEELPRLADPTAIHFTHLTARFRRSFLKTFWCPAHECLCDSVALQAPDHAGTPALPDPDQLLVAILPFSAIPRTKQRQFVAQLHRTSLGAMGLRIAKPSAPKAGAKTAVLLSPLYLAWLAEAHLLTSDTPAVSLAEALVWLAQPHQLMAASPEHHLARYYHNGTLVPKSRHNPAAHGPTMAEVRRVWQLLDSVAGKSLGNSKRARITPILPPLHTS